MYCWFDPDPFSGSSERFPHLVILNASDLAYRGTWRQADDHGDAISSPVLGRNNILYVATHGYANDDRRGRVYAIDVNSATAPQIIWLHPPAFAGSIVSSPVIVADGKLYVGTQPSLQNPTTRPASIICFDISASAPWLPLWVCTIAGRPVDGTPAIGSDGTIYVPVDPSVLPPPAITPPSSLLAFNPRIQLAGIPLVVDWSGSTGDDYEGSTVIAANGNIFTKTVSDNNDAALVEYSPEGSQISAIPLGPEIFFWHKLPGSSGNAGISAVFSSPVVTPNGRLYVATSGTFTSPIPSGSGRLTCIDTGASGYSFWPNFRANRYNSGNVQDNRWTTNANPSASIFVSYQGSFNTVISGINTLGNAVGYRPTNAPYSFYAGAKWSVADGSAAFLPSLLSGYYGRNVYAWGLNDANEVVGSRQIDDAGTLRPHYWSSFTAIPQDLTMPGGPGDYTQGNAYQINRKGMIVGDSKNATGKWHAMRWLTKAYVGTDLQTFDSGNPLLQSDGYAVSSRGWTVGRSQLTTGGPFHGFATPPENNQILPANDLSPGFASEAHGMNGLGQIVGSSKQIGGTYEHACIWYVNANGSVAFKDLGTLGGTTSCALAINNRGHVVGWSYKSGSTTPVAFIWIPGWTSIRELRLFLSASDQLAWPNMWAATGISDDGNVVGYLYNSSFSQSFGFIIKPKP